MIACGLDGLRRLEAVAALNCLRQRARLVQYINSRTNARGCFIDDVVRACVVAETALSVNATMADETRIATPCVALELEGDAAHAIHNSVLDAMNAFGYTICVLSRAVGLLQYVIIPQ